MGSILPKPTTRCLFIACLFDMNPPNSTSIVLIFGPFDPTGSDGLPADAITCAALNGHALATLTAVTIQDSADTEAVLPCPAEQIDDQARCLLEDIPVQAIKVGQLSSVEAASAVAQIAADYSQVPMVLHLGQQEVDTEEVSEDDDEVQDLVGAVIELLVPQAQVVVVDGKRLAQWVTEDLLEASGQTAGPQALQAIGAGWVLVIGHQQRPGYQVNTLIGPQNETITWPWIAPPERLRDTGGLVATALATLLAQGLEVPEAARQACTHAERAVAQSFQPGMGNRIARRLALGA
jgi:hydroxymethylpyrimidine/phosphomethylpyrimidine kinase